MNYMTLKVATFVAFISVCIVLIFDVFGIGSLFMKLKNKIDKIRFKYACLKCKQTHKKVIKQQLKTLKFCLFTIIDTGYPINDIDCEILERAVSLYNETSTYMNKDVKRCNEYIANYKEITR